MSGRHNNRKLWLLVLSTLLVFATALSGCGRPTDTSGISGEWILERAESEDIAIPDGIVQDNELLLRLDPNGSGLLSGTLEEGRILWRYEQGSVQITAGNRMLTGTVEGDAIVLETEDGNTILRFVPEAGNLHEDQKALPLAEPYLGDWYGWWKIEDSTGAMPVSWYDCCAAFEETEEGIVRFTFWDEDGSRTEPFSSVDFRISEDRTLSSLNGYFDSMEIRRGDWSVEIPNPGILLPDILYSEEGERFRATIYLRPWGDSWGDAEDGQKPFYYDDWYFPLVAEKASMPDRIPWQDLEAARARPGRQANEISDGS